MIVKADMKKKKLKAELVKAKKKLKDTRSKLKEVEAGLAVFESTIVTLAAAPKETGALHSRRCRSDGREERKHKLNTNGRTPERRLSVII